MTHNAKKLSGAAIATAAAGLILSGCESMGPGDDSASAKQASVHCYGVNACKGTTACKTAGNACKGQNACKGTGWLPMSKSECEAKGGKLEG